MTWLFSQSDSSLSTADTQSPHLGGDHSKVSVFVNGVIRLCVDGSTRVSVRCSFSFWTEASWYRVGLGIKREGVERKERGYHWISATVGIELRVQYLTAVNAQKDRGLAHSVIMVFFSNPKQFPTSTPAELNQWQTTNVACISRPDWHTVSSKFFQLLV